MSGGQGRPSWPTVATLTIAYWVSMTMLRPLLAPYAHGLGAPPWLIGVILASQALSAFVIGLPTGTVADRSGYKKVAVLGGVAMLVSGAIMASVPSILPLVISQILLGAGALAVWLSIQGLMIKSDPGEAKAARDRRIANYSLVVVIGQLVGPTAGGLLVDLASFQIAMVVFGLLTATVMACALLLPRIGAGREGGGSGEPITSRALTGSFREAGRMLAGPGVALTLAVTFAALYLLDVQQTFHPLYLQSIGVSASTTGLMLSCGSAAGLFARLILPRLLGRFRVGTVVASCLIPGAVAVSGVVLVESAPALFALVALAGLSLGMAQPLTLRLTADVTGVGERGMGIALRLMANRTAQWVNGVVFGALATFGLVVAYGVTGVLILSVAVVAAVSFNRRFV